MYNVFSTREIGVLKGGELDANSKTNAHIQMYC